MKSKTRQGQRAKQRRFFAIASVGKNRWYWVVWPSLAMLQAGEAAQHLAAGIAPSKAEAVDEALEIAGIDGEWVAAKYAKDYHRQTRRQQRGEADSATAPTLIEFLYQDVQDPESEAWYSVPHRIIRKTPKYIFVEKARYDPHHQTGSWLNHKTATWRLDRGLLEAEGYALAPIGDIEDPLFFTAPYQDRTDAAPACFAQLGLDFPASQAQVKAAFRQRAKVVHPDQGGDHESFLRLKAAYELALRLCDS